jgi:hypothetical protein
MSYSRSKLVPLIKGLESSLGWLLYHPIGFFSLERHPSCRQHARCKNLQSQIFRQAQVRCLASLRPFRGAI